MTRRGKIAFYVLLTIAGVCAFTALSGYATRVRGYFGIGGEVFALFLPVLYYLGERTVCELMETLAGIWREDRH